MFITVNEQEYELHAKLGTVKRIEDHFKLNLSQIFGHLGEAKTDEMIKIIKIASRLESDDSKKLGDAIEDDWDYGDLMQCVKDLILQMLFSGTPEDQEKKISNYTDDETAKNEIRGLLGLPKKPTSQAD